MTPWTSEAECMWKYMDRPLDAYTVQILEARILEPPLTIGTKRSRDGRRLCSQVDVRSGELMFRPGSLQFMEDIRAVPGAPNRTATEDSVTLATLLRSWNVDCEKVDCYWLLEPVLRLILLGRWKTILMCANMPVSVSEALQWPPKAWFANMAKKKGKHLPPPKDASLDLGLLEDMKHSLRAWAPAVASAAASAGEDGFDEEMFKLHRYVSFLDRFTHNMEPEQIVALGFHARRWKARKLLMSVIVSSHLQDKGMMEKLLNKSIELSVPEPLQKACVHEMSELLMKTVSKARVSRAQLAVDCTLMREVAFRRKGVNMFLYFWAGSSPQANSNWMVSSYAAIRADNIVSLLATAHRLINSAQEWHQCCGLPDSGEREARMLSIAKERDSLGLLVCESISVHKQVPVALGHMAAGLEAKTRAILHGLRLECSGDDEVRRALLHTVSITPDMGVEMGIADTRGGGFQGLPPGVVSDKVGARA